MVRATQHRHASFQGLIDHSGRINYHFQHGECKFEALSASTRICPLLTYILAYEVHGSRPKGLQHGRVHLDRWQERCSLEDQGTCAAYFPSTYSLNAGFHLFLVRAKKLQKRSYRLNG